MMKFTDFQNNLPWNKESKNKQREPETILQLEGTKSTAKNVGNLVTMGHLKVQDQFPIWGDYSYVLPYLPSSESEKQVYLQGSKLSMLTNHRIVEISQLRPIDHLFTILNSLSETNRSQVSYYDNFIDFASVYTMEEACSMLVQILSDTQATYSLSSRLSHLLNMKRTIEYRESRMQPTMSMRKNRQQGPH